MADQLELHLASLASLDEPLLTPAEAATLLAVRRSWIYDAARNGQLPCVRVGRHVRFLRSDLGRWVSSQRTRRPQIASSLASPSTTRRGAASARSPSSATSRSPTTSAGSSSTNCTAAPIAWSPASRPPSPL